MSDLGARKGAAQAAIAAAADDLHRLSLAIHARPELNFEEEHAHGALTAYLERAGFAVERRAYGIRTAFVARAGAGAPTLAVFCEYDALPGIGHGCGHNLIAAAGVAVGLGVRAALGEGAGTILVVGSPAEEGGGGKIELLARDALAGVDAAMMVHPAPVDSVRPEIVALQALEVEFFGVGAHAAMAPWEGINALDALLQAYSGLSLLRQQMMPDARVHGVITDGGDKPNIIPAHSAAEFYVRAKDGRGLATLQERVLACFRGAAEATGCRLEHRWVGHPYRELVSNEPMAAAYETNAAALGPPLPAPTDPPAAFSASTDMGNVSQTLPAIHPVFAIPTEHGNHTAGFAAAAATPQAHDAMLRAATALALTAIDLYGRPDLLAAARDAFRAAPAD